MPADPEPRRHDALIRQARIIARDEPVDLRISGGRLAEVGPSLRADPTEEVFDAAGRWAIPGLWDAHVHFRQWAQNTWAQNNRIGGRTRLHLGAARSAAEAAELVRRHAATLPEADSPIFGSGHRSALWPAPPTTAQLDVAGGTHPVLLISGDAHNGWLNTAAFTLLGIEPSPGALAENAWFALMPAITELAGRLSDDSAALDRAVTEAAARGVVGITDFEFADGFIDWPERYARGIDRLRVRPAVYPDGLDAVIAAGLRTGDPLPGTGGLATMGPLKIISDGSLNTRTAFCREAYADAPADSPHPAGRANYSVDELTQLLARAQAHGLEVAVHAIGDAAVEIALDVFAATGAHGGIEHAQLVRREDVPRMAVLGVRASVQPAHLWDDRDVTQRCWPDRADRCFPFRSLADAGVTLALGSDAPVSPLDPWLAMAAAVHRSADDREPWNPAEAITVREALAASTDGQTLEPGARGDLVLLDDDPHRPVGDSAATAQHLRNIRVAATVVAGRPTYLAL